jgi:hypothetical protein
MVQKGGKEIDRVGDIRVGDRFIFTHEYWENYSHVDIVGYDDGCVIDPWRVVFTPKDGPTSDRTWSEEGIRNKFFPPYGRRDEVSEVKRLLEEYDS